MLPVYTPQELGNISFLADRFQTTDTGAKTCRTIYTFLLEPGEGVIWLLQLPESNSPKSFSTNQTYDGTSQRNHKSTFTGVTDDMISCAHQAGPGKKSVIICGSRIVVVSGTASSVFHIYPFCPGKVSFTSHDSRIIAVCAKTIGIICAKLSSKRLGDCLLPHST